MHSDTQARGGFVPPVVRGLVYVALLLIPLIITFRFHHLPYDDGLRHAAKAVSGKAWQEILVMRPEITIDQHDGWHKSLALVHRATGCDAAFLVVISMIGLFLLFALAPLPLFARPEAWVASLLLAMLASPYGFIFRLTRARPYILTMAVLAILLLAPRRSPVRCFFLTMLLTALATWMHGSWYLFALVAAAFLLAGERRDAAVFAAGWLAGALLGATLTGHPFAFLHQQVLHMTLAFGYGGLHRMLVDEFTPFAGAFGFVMIAAVTLLARRVLDARWDPRWVRNPAFALAVLGWILGFHVARFWLDWGLPAFVVWLALQIQDLIRERIAAGSGVRLLVSALLCVALVLAATGDLDGRWSGLASDADYTPADPQLAEWLPGDGGIFYSASMNVFDTFFFHNPRAPWRYVYGYEAGLMRDDDLRTLRDIQYRSGDPRAYEPWVRKMRPEDRLLVVRDSPAPPAIGELEWYRGPDGVWFGRLPRGEP